MSNVQHSGLTSTDLHIPKVHKDSHVDGTDDIQNATSGQKGLATAAQITQLDDAVLESDIKDQSFTNLLENGDFESWSAGVGAAPDGWVFNGAAGTHVAKETTTVKINSASCELLRDTGGGPPKLIQSVPNYADYKGKTVTFSAWLNCNSGADVTRIYIDDGVNVIYSSFHNATNVWEWLSASTTVDASATKLEVGYHGGGSGIKSYIDGAILVEGSVCPAFSPKPLVDDGQSIVIDPATNKVTLGNLFVCEPSSDASITAAGGITVTNTIMRVVGNGGAIDITANPQIAAGTDGQIVIVQGTHDTNTVKLDNGAGLALSASITLAKNDNITLMYDLGESAWIETSRTTVA